MAENPFSTIAFRAYDYEGFKQSLFDIAKDPATGNPFWTDTLESNAGVTFVEWLAFIAANRAYQQNFHAKQAFISTAQTDKAMRIHAKSFDYEIPSNEAAGTDVKFYTTDGEPLIADLFIVEGTKIYTTGATKLTFEVTETTVFPEGSDEVLVPVRNWQSRTYQDSGDGTANQSYTLPYGPYVQDTLEISVDGQLWAKVSNFLSSAANAEHYTLEVEADGKPTVYFGDGINGKVPDLDSEILFSYKIGGGSVGIVSPGSITEFTETINDVEGNPVQLSVINEAASIGGVDVEDIEVTRIKLPQSLRQSEATISEDDFDILVSGVAGAARGRALTVNENPLIPENTVMLIVLPESGDVVTQQLRGDIEQALEENPNVLTQAVWIIDPDFVTIEIEIRDMLLRVADIDGQYATATIEVLDNAFDVGDSITINGVEFVIGVDIAIGLDEDDTASAIAAAVELSADPLLKDIDATVENTIVTLASRTKGLHGNNYTLSIEDGVTENLSISGANFENGLDSTTQALVRAAIDTHFTRTNISPITGEYSINFGETIYDTELIRIIKSVNNVLDFDLTSPADDVSLGVNQYPKYSLIFTTTEV